MLGFSFIFLIIGSQVGGVAAQDVSFRIADGRPATIEQYPSLVQVDFLHTSWSHVCSGNIITEKYVLSAAHCFSGEGYLPSYRRIRAGTTKRSVGGVIVYVLREYNYPTFSYFGSDGDVTVVLLATPLTFSTVIKPGRIVAQGTVIPDNTPVTVAGWGVTKNGLPSDILLDATLYTVNNELCAEQYQTLSDSANVTETMICAGLFGVGGRDSCAGDSGGALYLGELIVGIVSWGHVCAAPDFPGVNTAVAFYADWILSIVT